MHARELIELAGLISTHGPLLVESHEPVADENIERYWMTSKVRLDRWAHSLKGFAEGGKGDRHLLPERPSGCFAQKVPVPFSASAWQRVCGVVEEILVSEVLTRVWTAVLCAYDRRHGADDAGPVARSVMLGHIEARHRALTLVVQAEKEAAVKLNRLRRRAERWTDVLVGHLAAAEKGTGTFCAKHPEGRSGKRCLSPFPPFSAFEFAADRARAKDFAEELHCRGASERRRFAWPLLLASLRGAFQRGMDAPSPNAELNARIAASIIACFPAELFAGTGLFHSVWMMHLMNVADDAQGMIDQLLALPRATGPHDRSLCTRNDRLRRFGQ
jgi:hypothetical protein